MLNNAVAKKELKPIAGRHQTNRKQIISANLDIG